MDMTSLEIFSACCLSVVALLTGVAIFCQNYHENWLQFVGLAGLSVWCSARVSQLIDLFDGRMPLQGPMLHAALLCYALGTAWKVWEHRPPLRDAPPPAPYKLEPDEMSQVAGGRQP